MGKRILLSQNETNISEMMFGNRVKRSHKAKREEPDPLPKRQNSFYNFEPEPDVKVKIERPPAIYDNKSVYDKYLEK
jgi:hypothetical protein